jgi:hypothetical protein
MVRSLVLFVYMPDGAFNVVANPDEFSAVVAAGEQNDGDAEHL